MRHKFWKVVVFGGLSIWLVSIFIAPKHDMAGTSARPVCQGTSECIAECTGLQSDPALSEEIIDACFDRCNLDECLAGGVR